MLIPEEQDLLLVQELVDQDRQVCLHADEPAHIEQTVELVIHMVLQSRRSIPSTAALEDFSPGYLSLGKLPGFAPKTLHISFRQFHVRRLRC